MANTIWIDADNRNVGDVGFLIETFHILRRTQSFHLSDSPARKNLSGEPTLNEWCGSTNDVSTDAFGLARIVKLSRNGERAQVVRLTDDDEVKAELEEMGWPDLL